MSIVMKADIFTDFTGNLKIVFVTSGKGGVGKSTVAWNLAIALREKGHIVGVLDADVHGPSVPILSKFYSRLKVSERHIHPHHIEGLYLISFGFLTTPERPLPWTGPVLTGAIKHILDTVVWPVLDYLVIDLPPGTGDVHLVLLQHFQRSNSIVVTTPHELALADTKRGIGLFRRSNSKILGIIENMAAFQCKHCGEFHSLEVGNGVSISDEFGLPVLARLPFSTSRSSFDAAMKGQLLHVAHVIEGESI